MEGLYRSNFTFGGLGPPYFTFLGGLPTLSDIDSGHNSVTINKVIIVVIDYNSLKY